MGGADREGPGQAARLLLRPAGGACHRGPGHSDGGAVRLSHAAGQLHQSERGAHRHGPHLGQDAELQGGGVNQPRQKKIQIVYLLNNFNNPFCLVKFPPQVFNGCILRRREHEGGRRRVRVSGSAAQTRLLHPGCTGRPGLQVGNMATLFYFILFFRFRFNNKKQNLLTWQRAVPAF